MKIVVTGEMGLDLREIPMFDKKILCIGAEIQETDTLVSHLATENSTVNHGLINDKDFNPEAPGYYHITLADLSEGQIQKILMYFDLILLLDQDRSKYPHWKSLLRTFRFFKSLERNYDIPLEYKNNANIAKLEYWWNYLRTNHSFCFHPFLALVSHDNQAALCPKTPVFPNKKTVYEIKDWRNDPDYRKVRDEMIGGIKQHNYCRDCYDKEERGIESTRQFETMEWIARMDYESPEDLNQVSYPIFHEFRPSNKCNLMCRMCDDAYSHLIEKEKIKLNIPLTPWRYKDMPADLVKFETLERVYFGGGEPTIMPEFFNFLEKCIAIGRTDFELTIGTNGMKFSNRMLDLLSHFSDVVFSISFDGYGRINDYQRWLSDFNVITKNAHLVLSLGHKLGLQTVPSMYNVTRLHELFEFYDREFPKSTCLVQAAEGHGGALRPWNHPRADLVVSSMQRCMKTEHYLQGGRSSQSYIDGIYALYSSPDFKPDLNLLKKFFEYNDKLDLARGSRLADYVPELEECRKLIL